MNYVKSCLIITMLLGVQIGYSQDCDPLAGIGWNCDCNEDTWQEYYNSEGHNMEGCWLYEASLDYVNLLEANLTGANGEFLSLWFANLSGADLSWVALVNSLLWETNFEGANLLGADLSSADLNNNNFCNLVGSPSEDICEAPVTDNNGDGYDDVSYDAGAESGDLNLDGTDNIQDIVILVNNILNP